LNGCANRGAMACRGARCWPQRTFNCTRPDVCWG
jgi:hypothetical protein